MALHSSFDQAVQAGLAAFRCGDFSGAIAAFERALALSPQHPAALDLLGTSWLAAGDPARALPLLEQAVQRAKNNPDAIVHLAQAYQALARHEDAYQQFRKASRLAPQNPHFGEGAAIALALLGRFAEAEQLLLRLIARYPDISALRFNLGNVYRDQQRFADAEMQYRSAIRCAPDDAASHNNLGSVCHSQLKFTEAAQAYRAAIAIDPQFHDAHLNLVSVLIDCGSFQEAIVAGQASIALAPNWALAHRYIGAAFSHLGHTQAALNAYARACALDPNDAIHQQVHGSALVTAGQTLAGLRTLNSASQITTNANGLEHPFSDIHLAIGLYAIGWDDYRKRPASAAIADKYLTQHSWVIHQSLPADLNGRHVCVLREQGLGDELFFLRYVPQLKARGAQVTTRVSAKIAHFIERAQCADVVIDESQLPAQVVDFFILCGDLPHALAGIAPQSAWTGPQPQTEYHIPECHIPEYPIAIRVYHPPLAPSLAIPALPELLNHIQARLATYGPPPYIGITWRAGTAAQNQGADWLLSKALPLTALGAALQLTTATLLALQRQPAPGELAELSRACARTVHDCTDLNDNLEAMLALLYIIDDYVGVSNTNMHLRTAARRRARVLVPNPAEWRWCYNRHHSPWFPDWPLYRQSPEGEWTQALLQLGHDLMHINSPQPVLPNQQAKA